MWKYCNLNMLIRFADWIQLTASPTVVNKVPKPLRAMCVSTFLKTLRSAASHPLAQHSHRAEAVSLREVYYSVFKTLYPKVLHTLVQHGHQLLLVAHGQVRPCRIPAYLTGQEIRMRSRGKIWTYSSTG